MLALSRATTPGWSKLEKQKTDFTSVGCVAQLLLDSWPVLLRCAWQRFEFWCVLCYIRTWESVKHKQMDELEDAFNRGEPIAT